MLRVFGSLNADYSSDADDVALAYVNYARRDAQLKATIASNRALRDFLIKVMSEGWTSSADEQLAINFYARCSPAALRRRSRTTAFAKANASRIERLHNTFLPRTSIATVGVGILPSCAGATASVRDFPTTANTAWLTRAIKQIVITGAAVLSKPAKPLLRRLVTLLQKDSPSAAHSSACSGSCLSAELAIQTT